MHAYVAVAYAVRETARLVDRARADVPVRPRVGRERAAGERSRSHLVLSRRRLSLGLRRLADLVEPTPRCPTPALPC